MRRASLLSLLPLLLLPVLAVTGCGGSDDSDNGDLVPAGTVRFRDVSSDFNGTSTDLASAAGVLTTSSSSATIQVASGERTLTFTIPGTTPTVGSVFLLDGTVPGASARYQRTIATPAEDRIWQSVGGSVTVTESTPTSLTLQVSNVRFSPVTTGSTSVGNFTLAGTAQGVSVLTKTK